MLAGESILNMTETDLLDMLDTDEVRPVANQTRQLQKGK